MPRKGIGPAANHRSDGAASGGAFECDRRLQRVPAESLGLDTELIDPVGNVHVDPHTERLNMHRRTLDAVAVVQPAKLAEAAQWTSPNALMVRAKPRNRSSPSLRSW